ncbi:hypothetical protein AAES_44115 [Amazona aestiva]|uniref:Uncharacterized protein n=1 Tax=Amazona aestiva TaxID=12930 RepID=A0A0Q3MR37_AMAAE|nr:hypothetical protein AAES_44115 [Amazona aestiva]
MGQGCDWTKLLPPASREAINCLLRAIEIYTDMGRFTIAAKHHVSIAEIYETELVDIEKKLLEAHEEQNVDGYTDAVKEYDSISRLDQWLTTMLLRIKKTIQGEEEDLR